MVFLKRPCAYPQRPDPDSDDSDDSEEEEEEEEEEYEDDPLSTSESGEEGVRLGRWSLYRSQLEYWWEEHTKASPVPSTPPGTPPPDIEEGERRVQWADGGRQRWAVEHQESEVRMEWERMLEVELEDGLERWVVEEEERDVRRQWGLRSEVELEMLLWHRRWVQLRLERWAVEQEESEARRALQEGW